jgi:hypothetical protein
MSTVHDEWNPLDDRTLDRLVDGALTAEERRALLARFEREPEGWRRCALAFLEAQAWCEALRPGSNGADRNEAMPDGRWPTADPAVMHLDGLRTTGLPTPGQIRNKLSQQPAALNRLAGLRWHSAVAAGLLAAFALGWAARGRGLEAPIAQASPRAVTPQHGEPSFMAQPVRTTESGLEPAAVSSPSLAMAAHPLPLPGPIVKRLEREGYQVESRQRLVSMETRDGRRLAVPVDEVRVRFVKDRTY